MFQNARKIIIPFIYIRQISTTNSNYGIERVMQKVLNQNKKKKTFYKDEPALPPSSTYLKSEFTQLTKTGRKRINVLNKLFMRHVTDLMATEEMASTYAGLGLEINRVQISSNFQVLNIFWVAKNNPDINIDEMLNESGKKLRRELSVLRVMGNVPKIFFVKDKQYAQATEIDQRLSQADFGEDYEPPDDLIKLKSELILNMSLKPKIKEEILKSEENIDIVDNTIPDMPQDVLGLNHKDIMDRIKIAMKKPHIKANVDITDQSFEGIINDQPIEFKSAKTQREAFKQFLMERQILKRKIRKANMIQTAEEQYFEDEYFEFRKRELESMGHLTNTDENDYIIEDDESEHRK